MKITVTQRFVTVPRIPPLSESDKKRVAELFESMARQYLLAAFSTPGSDEWEDTVFPSRTRRLDGVVYVGIC